MAVGVTPLLNWARREARIDQGYLRDVISEFFATFILCLFAVGGTCNLNAYSPGFAYNSTMSVIPVAFGYFITILLFGGVSGAHVNPAVSIGMAIAGRLSWIKLHAYILVQFLGGYLGSLLGFGLFKNLIENINQTGSIKLSSIPGSAALFNANRGAITIGAGFANEIVLTSIFMMTILAVRDMWNSRAPRHVHGLLIGLVVIGFGLAFGETTGVMINPVRDICPRIAALTMGWGSDAVMKGHLNANQWWSVGFIAPFIGAILGAFIYIFVIGAQQRFHDEDEGELVTVEGSGNQQGADKWRATVFIPKISIYRDENGRALTPTGPYNRGVQFQQ